MVCFINENNYYIRFYYFRDRIGSAGNIFTNPGILFCLNNGFNGFTKGLSDF